MIYLKNIKNKINMIKKKIPACLIGAGRIGLKLEFDQKRLKPASHFGMFTKNKSILLKGICDSNKIEKKYKRKIPKKIKIYKNYNKMIRLEKPRIVSISTWKDTHYKITNDCINFGIKVIILEKPLAKNIAEAKRLIKKIKKKRVKVLVNHRRRYDEDIIDLKNKIKEGIIGEIIQVSSFYVYGLLTTGTHLIDTLRMLLKDVCGDVDSVSGFKNNMGNFKSKDDENYDAVIKFKNGLNASIQSLDMKSYDNFDIYLYGKKGKILITGIGREILKFKIIDSPEHSKFTELSNLSTSINRSKKPRPQFRKLSENAIECLKKNKFPLCDAIESYKDMLIIEGIIKSSKKNSSFVKIKYQ